MKWCGLIFSGICLAGCMTNKGLETDAVADNNRYHLSKVRKGMYEAQVLSIMRQPYKYESFELGEDIYDVWFYVTNPTVLGQSRMVAQNLTPLSFKNGVLVGTGYDYYYYVTRESAKQAAAALPPEPKTPPVQPRPPSQTPEAPTQAPAPKSKKTSPAENKGLEESLQKAVKPTSPPPQSPAPAPKQSKPETLQPDPKPTAPILSLTEPDAEQGNCASLFSRKSGLSKVRKGMSEAEVQEAMGAPVDSQSFELGEDNYEVWFYETKNSHRIPLTFKNGILVSTTSDYYEGIKQAASHDQVNGYDKKGERMQQDEMEQDFDYW